MSPEAPPSPPEAHPRDPCAGHHGPYPEARPPSRRARFGLYGAGVLLVLVAAGFLWLLRHRHAVADREERDKREHQLALGPKVPVVAAVPAPATRKVIVPGDVRAYRLAVVYARTSGYLTQLAVDRGDRVTRDQVLGRVTVPENDQQLTPLISNLEALRKIADRLRPLVPKGVVAQQDLDRANADVEAAKSQVDRLTAVRDLDAIRAPFDGIVTRRYVDVGALMPAPSGATQSAQPLVDVADTSRVRVVVYLGQRDATGVRVGDRISIARDDDPLHPIAGTITRIPSDLDPTTRTMWVESDIENPTGALFPGLFVTVTLDVAAPRGVLIPSDAIALVSGKPSVAVVRDGTVHFVAIEVADDDGKLARVIRGVGPGDAIANRISDELTDGAKVRAVRAPVVTQGPGAGSAGSAAAPAAPPAPAPRPSAERGGKPGACPTAVGSGAVPAGCPKPKKRPVLGFQQGRVP